MREVETDYLVVGAGAAGMAFADTLVAHTDAEVMLVDRRHRPGGHWLDAYPFVRLHQPSAYYGVESRPLGNDRIDEHGPNAGFYERASGPEICDYYSRVLDEHLLPTGRVRFVGTSEHHGTNGDGHLVVSLLDGSEILVKPRRKVVDATYVQSEIPSRHVPGFTVEPGVTLVPPNDLVDLGEPADRFTVVGAGKTGMDTCVWLLEAGVDPDRIRWIRARDPWQFDRNFMQPLNLVGSIMRLRARWVETAAAAKDGRDFARRLEDAGVFVRIDPSVEPLAYRGATVSPREIDALRTIEQVVRTSGAEHRPDDGHDRRGRHPRRPARGLRRLHGRRRSSHGSATGLRAGPHHDPVRDHGSHTMVRRHHRDRRVDRRRRRGEEPALPTGRLLRRRGRSGAVRLQRDAGPGRAGPR